VNWQSPADEHPKGARRRIHGDREHEILQATLDVLGEVGYDRLTLDAVAGRASASKATLYRHFKGKATLVIEALRAVRPLPVAVDTGSLREDLLLIYAASPGYADGRLLAVLAAVTSAIAHDPDFATAFRSTVLKPRISQTSDVYRRAQVRGEARSDLDLDVLVPVLASLLLHRQLLYADPPDAAFVERVVDGLILPAVHPSDCRRAPS
jgi:AcrR family transcriptional regulator